MHYLTEFLRIDFLKDHFIDIFNFYVRSTHFLENNIFYYSLFSFLMCFFATFLILVNNPIYSVISLILVYLAASFMLVFIEVHFLAVLFILVYLGAVVVLFLFIVMMLNIKVMAPLSLFTFIPIFLIFLILGFFISMFDIAFKSTINFIPSLEIVKITFVEFTPYFAIGRLFFDTFNIDLLNYRYEHFNVLAFLLYTHFFVELCVAAFVLLLAMVGCIALTLGKEPFSLRKQHQMGQILRRTIFLIKTKK